MLDLEEDIMPTLCKNLLDCGKTSEIVDEGLLEILPRMYGLARQALEPRQRCGLQGHREVEDLGVGVSLCNTNSGRV